MSYSYAHVVDGIILNLIVANADWVSQQTNPEQYVVYTSAMPAHMGGEYANGFFYEPQPFPSWTMDTNTPKWIPPIPRPEGVVGTYFDWNESEQDWSPRQEALVWNADLSQWEPAEGFGFNPDYTD
jgi:hypothetical protein